MIFFVSSEPMVNRFFKNIHKSAENIPFLVLKVELKDSKITTDLHVKPVDRQQYLHFSSAHPKHTKHSVAFSQTLRMSRLCSNESDFERNKEKMRSWFVKREYPKKLIDSEIRKVKFNIKKNNRKNKSKNGVPFIVTYHPLLNSFYGIIRQNLYILNMDEKVIQIKRYSIHNPWCLSVAPIN